jgi:hypothetical protein
LKLIKIQTDNSDWKVVVFHHSDNPVGQFFASKNPNGNTNKDFPFDITFKSPKYDELMAKILDKQDDIQDWLVDVHATEKLFL